LPSMRVRPPMSTYTIPASGTAGPGGRPRPRQLRSRSPPTRSGPERVAGPTFRPRLARRRPADRRSQRGPGPPASGGNRMDHSPPPVRRTHGRCDGRSGSAATQLCGRIAAPPGANSHDGIPVLSDRGTWVANAPKRHRPGLPPDPWTRVPLNPQEEQSGTTARARHTCIPLLAAWGHGWPPPGLDAGSWPGAQHGVDAHGGHPVQRRTEHCRADAAFLHGLLNARGRMTPAPRSRRRPPTGQ
jgi:hypothetical protein